MPSVTFISQHQQLLDQLLTGRKELRREMLAYLVSLDEVWAKLPKEIPADERVKLLDKITEKFIDEMLYSMSMLDRRYDELLVDYNSTEKSRLESTIKELTDALAKREAEYGHLMDDSQNKENELSQRLNGLEHEHQSVLKRQNQFERCFRELEQLVKQGKDKFWGGDFSADNVGKVLQKMKAI